VLLFTVKDWLQTSIVCHAASATAGTAFQVAMRNPARPSSVKHESEGMLSFFRRKRAGGDALNSGTGAGGCAVAEEIPVCTTRPEESAAARPKWSRNNSRLTDAHINYLVLGECAGQMTLSDPIYRWGQEVY
jgi:hypothetical protein